MEFIINDTDAKVVFTSDVMLDKVFLLSVLVCCSVVVLWCGVLLVCALFLTSAIVFINELPDIKICS